MFRNAFLTVPNPDAGVAQRQLEAALTKFKYNLEHSLFPVLKAASGEFELQARYDVMTETIVDLHFNDYFAGRGISGQTSSEMLVRFRQDVIDLNPKVVVIMNPAVVSVS